MGGSEQMDTSEAALGTRMQKKNWLRNFGELLDEKLFSRAPLRDSEPSRAANAISGVFLVNRVIKHGTGEESRDEKRVEDPEEPNFGRVRRFSCSKRSLYGRHSYFCMDSYAKTLAPSYSQLHSWQECAQCKYFSRVFPHPCATSTRLSRARDGGGQRVGPVEVQRCGNTPVPCGSEIPKNHSWPKRYGVWGHRIPRL